MACKPCGCLVRRHLDEGIDDMPAHVKVCPSLGSTALLVALQGLGEVEACKCGYLGRCASPCQNMRPDLSCCAHATAWLAAGFPNTKKTKVLGP